MAGQKVPSFKRRTSHGDAFGVISQGSASDAQTGGAAGFPVGRQKDSSFAAKCSWGLPCGRVSLVFDETEKRSK
jgi:hypothetical protein